MILEQYFLECLAQSSYLIGDESSGRAVIVDPRRDVDEYVTILSGRGLTLEAVVLTHFHADFAAGHLELQRRTGAAIRLGRAADATYEFVPLADGDVIDLGAVRITAWETPGHTPESICLLVHDEGEADPHAVLTGDTLFVGDVGRPDLMASIGVTAEELAVQLYASTRRLLELPDATIVYPGHGAGSMCGKSMSNETFTTIGAQRATNYALRPMSEAEFVAVVTADQPVAPRYFAFDAGLNRSVHADLADALDTAARPMTLDEVLAAATAGAVVLDTREAAEFATGHLTGAVNVGLEGRFAMWVGAVVAPESEVVLVTPPGREAEAALRLGRIGYDRVIGHLEGGADAWRTRPEATTTSRRIDPAGFAAATSSEDVFILDVRGEGEYATAHISGAVNIPLQALHDRLGELPSKDTPIALHCRSGYRSSAAASILRGAGYTALVDLEGGIDAWTDAGQPVEGTGEGCSLS